LEEIFEALGERPKGTKYKVMVGPVAESAEIIDKDLANAVKDAALIGAP
jgi:ferritin-like metal-binding protein YciE